jgi:ABC-2 type transport system ATP-binding protein
MDTPAIETHDLSRSYGSLMAVKELNLTVPPGELFAYLGPNGAGKTTTIRMLTGLIRPTSGSALIDGLDIARDSLEAKARVGVVPQRSNLYGELSARDNLLFVGGIYGLSRARRRGRADALLEQFGLADRSATPFAALSGGMKRRLTIAAALVHEPGILFLDEPTTGLDVQAARGLRATIEALHAQGVTVFLTTHMIAEAERLADRVAILVEGSLVAVDTPANLRARCATESALELTLAPGQNGLVQALQEVPEVLGVSRSGDTWHLSVTAVDDALRGVLATLGASGTKVRAVRTVTPTLEDAFVQLTHLDAEAMQGGGRNNQGGGRA